MYDPLIEAELKKLKKIIQAEKNSQDIQQTDDIDNIYQKLDHLVGMEIVKNEVKGLINMLKVQKRKQQGTSINYLVEKNDPDIKGYSQ